MTVIRLDNGNIECVFSDTTQTLPQELIEQAALLNVKKSPLRLLYVPGPGDVRGSFLHWVEGRDDPSILAIAYSQQVYEVATQIGAEVVTLTEGLVCVEDAQPRPGFLFRQCQHFGGQSFIYHIFEIAYILRVIFYALKYRANIVIFQRQIQHYWLLIVLKYFSLKLIISLHNSLWPVSRSPNRLEALIWRLNCNTLQKSCQQIICVSVAIKTQLQKFFCGGYDRISVQIPQYPDTLRKAYRVRTGGSRLIYLGRIEENKGVFDLLRAFERIATGHPYAELRFIGDGGDLEKLQEIVKVSPAAAQIGVYGSRDGLDVLEELDRSDLLVCPSTTRFAEGLAKTPIEAAILGVPSLVSSNVPCAELLSDAVRVYPADDICRLAHELEDLLDNPSSIERMSVKAGCRRELFFDRRMSLATKLLLALCSASR